MIINPTISALWLCLSVFQNTLPDPAPVKENLFINSQQLTTIKPLQLIFLKGEIQLSDNYRKMIRIWARKTIKYDIPVYIHSHATLPTGIRNLTEDAARHEALRTAFNRGIIARDFLENSGIPKKRLILKTNIATKSRINPQGKDSVTLTLRRD